MSRIADCCTVLTDHLKSHLFFFARTSASQDFYFGYANSYFVVVVVVVVVVTFRLSGRLREMYIGHARLCVCLSVPRRIPTLLHGPRCSLEEW